MSITISWIRPNGAEQTITLGDLVGGAVLPTDISLVTMARPGAEEGKGFEAKPEVIRGLIAGGELSAFDEDLRSGASIELALRARLDDFSISYEHCGTSWKGRHSCACNDECPCCGGEIEPTTYEQVAGMDWEQPAGIMKPPKPAPARRSRP
jgi:hypothetical protein